MVMQKLTDRSKALRKKKHEASMMAKKTVKYPDEPKMTKVNPAKEPKNKRS